MSSLFKNQNPIEVTEFQKLPKPKIENGGTTQFARRRGTTVSEFCLGVTNSRKLTHPTNHDGCGPCTLPAPPCVVNLPIPGTTSTVSCAGWPGPRNRVNRVFHTFGPASRAPGTRQPATTAAITGWPPQETGENADLDQSRCPSGRRHRGIRPRGCHARIPCQAGLPVGRPGGSGALARHEIRCGPKTLTPSC